MADIKSVNIYEKLTNIQVELKAPKNQRNTFGNYNYRSCEDILEAVKPLLEKHKVTLLIGDEIVAIGERNPLLFKEEVYDNKVKKMKEETRVTGNQRYYVKATATLIDTEKDMRISTTAYAREEEIKKGMDSSQITGSASSYARKYALNGLFAIDDTKDSDYINTHGKEQNSEKYKVNVPGSKGQQDPMPPKAPPKQEPTEPMITKEQQDEIFKLAKEKNYTPESMTNYLKNAYNKPSSKELTYKEADELIKMLKGNKGE